MKFDYGIKRIRQILCMIILFGALFINGCGGTKVVLTTGFEKNEVFKIADTKCMLNEAKVYLSDVQYQYESVYGEGIWNASLDGVTLEENIKDTVLAKIAQVKTLYTLALSKGVSLDEEETEKVKACAEEYYGSLDEEQIEYLGVTEADVVKMYTEYALSEKVVQTLMEGINPEISDDEARCVEVIYIYLATGVTDGAGNFVSYEQNDKSTIFNNAEQIIEKANAGEDFEELATQYSDVDSTRLNVYRGELTEDIEKVVFDLSNGEISRIVENERGYHIFKCVSTFNREETENNKIKLVEERRQQIIEEEYNGFVSSLLKNLNQELWDTVELSKDVKIQIGFFDIYNENFSVKEQE